MFFSCNVVSYSLRQQKKYVFQYTVLHLKHLCCLNGYSSKVTKMPLGASDCDNTFFHRALTTYGVFPEDNLRHTLT